MPKAEAVKEETSRTGRCCKLSRYRIRSIRTAGSMHDKCWPNRLRRKSCQAPQFPYHPPNPTKQTTNPAKISWPTLHAINPQKRTIEVVLRRANTMQESIRKIVATAGCPILAVPLFLRQGWETTKASPSSSLPLAGCPILAVPLFLRQGWETTKASPSLSLARPQRPTLAKTSPKVSQKRAKHTR